MSEVLQRPATLTAIEQHTLDGEFTINCDFEEPPANSKTIKVAKKTKGKIFAPQIIIDIANSAELSKVKRSSPSQKNIQTQPLKCDKKV
jgi:hypothetical protein